MDSTSPPAQPQEENKVVTTNESVPAQSNPPNQQQVDQPIVKEEKNEEPSKILTERPQQTNKEAEMMRNQKQNCKSQGMHTSSSKREISIQELKKLKEKIEKEYVERRNRVFLLQTEKDNLKGSIKETKKKVDMIKKFKQIKKDQKETILNVRQEDMNQTTSMKGKFQDYKSYSTSNIKTTNSELMKLKLKQANEIKDAAHKHELKIIQIKEEQRKLNIERHDFIVTKEAKMKMKKQRREERKKRKAEKTYNEKCLEIYEEIKAKEKGITEMEEEEKKMIEDLQSIQKKQKNCYEVLRKTING